MQKQHSIVIEGKNIDLTQAIKDYANEKVAHNSKSPRPNIPTFNDLDECIKIFEGLCIKYNLLIKLSSPAKLLPTWQYDWKEIFYHPWIENQKRFRS